MLDSLYYIFEKLHNSLNTKIDGTMILYLIWWKEKYVMTSKSRISPPKKMNLYKF